MSRPTAWLYLCRWNRQNILYKMLHSRSGNLAFIACSQLKISQWLNGTHKPLNSVGLQGDPWLQESRQHKTIFHHFFHLATFFTLFYLVCPIHLMEVSKDSLHHSYGIPQWMDSDLTCTWGTRLQWLCHIVMCGVHNTLEGYAAVHISKGRLDLLYKVSITEADTFVLGCTGYQTF